MNNYSVYWIRRTCHSDIFSEGYIGISNNTKRRFSEHKKNNSKHSAVSSAIKKYDDIVYEILYENLSLGEAIKKEIEYRPKKEIGWNIAEGGDMPPNMKGIKRPDHSKKMKGSNNPFYGKKHSKETRKKLSEMKSGEKNYFCGKSRPDHSEKMKKLKGKDYPKLKGYFITPLGKFESYKEACVELGMGATSLYNNCINLNEKKITSLSHSKNRFLKNNYDKSIVGKTYKELGFGFEYV
jgi:group I intron endonuclease